MFSAPAERRPGRGGARARARAPPPPAARLASIRKRKVALKGPIATPVGDGFRSVNVALRKAFSLFANVRPARTLIPGRYEGVDIVLIRENLEGLYSGVEHFIQVGDDPRAVGISEAIVTRGGCERAVRFAFEYAVTHGRKKVTVVHKANILKMVSGLFLEVGRAVAREYEGRVAMNDLIVDNCALQLVLRPEQFDVIVTTNLFGDILSDEISGLVGGLGVTPGANVGPAASIFEPVHGSAPDIAGKGIANPAAQMLAAAMLLTHLGEPAAAQRPGRGGEGTPRGAGGPTAGSLRAVSQEDAGAQVGRPLRRLPGRAPAACKPAGAGHLPPCRAAGDRVRLAPHRPAAGAEPHLGRGVCDRGIFPGAKDRPPDRDRGVAKAMRRVSMRHLAVAAVLVLVRPLAAQSGLTIYNDGRVLVSPTVAD